MSPKERQEFGEFLRRLREAQGLSFRAVEAEVGISNSYLYQIERGDRNPPKAEILRKLAALYKVSFITLAAAAGLQENEEVDLYQNQIDRAFDYVRRDPQFRYGMQSQQEELSVGTKRFFVEMYQKLHPELRLIEVANRPAADIEKDYEEEEE